jgi:uncharacterized protein (DUF302 family)
MTMDESKAVYVEHKSSVGFQETLDRLEAAIHKASMTVFAKIDHAAGAKSVGLSMLPATVLIYGQARGGTPLMQANPATALDLPLRALVREDAAGQTLLAFHPVKQLLASYRIPGELLAGLTKAQQLLVNAI